ncbi:MAG: CHAT domain-containing protein [Anaerolineae bacterium]|nr:CHAT domain-containing protein [Anaerolineae bacterium]
MTISLDPSINPIVLLYRLFDHQGVEPQDDAHYVGIKSVRLKDLGSEQTREIIHFLRKRAGRALHTCRLLAYEQPLIDFVPGSVVDWFDWDVIKDLGAQGALAGKCENVLLDWKQRLDQYAFDHYWPPGRDPIADCLSVLKELEVCDPAGQIFFLEMSLDKSELVAQHVLAEFPRLSGNVSVLIWRDPASMAASFSSFHSFLERVAQAASQPLLLLFHEPTEAYRGDFFRIHSFGGPAETLEARQQALAAQLEAFTDPILVGYDELRMVHQAERRPDVGERFHLSPALLLRQSGHLPPRLERPLCQEGPWRSLLIYILLAWLAERTEWQDDVAHFTLASGEELALAFELEDVRWEGASIFDTGADWQATILLLALDLQRSVGREPLRALWTRAISEQLAARYTADQLFEFLESIRQAFLAREQKPLEMGDLHPDLELRVFFEKDLTGGRLTFELHAPRLDLFHRPAGVRTVGAADAKPWLDDLDEMARSYLSRLLRPAEASGEVTVPNIQELEDWGGELWDELIPHELQRYYVQFRQQPELSILIVSSDPSFPWELVRPYAKRGDLIPERLDDVWWAMKFSLSRWLAGARPPANEIGFARVCCVAATTDLPAAVKEVALFQELDVELDLPQNRAELFRLLREKAYDVLHFSCHGQFKAARPDESGIVLPDGDVLVPRNFRDAGLEEMVSEHRPLVFLNACHAGQAGPTLTGLGGWAKRFIDMECGAFIGCGWEVSDQLAAEFAKCFYQSFQNGAALGRAVREARETLRNQGPDNSTWLAYYLYGNPYCSIEKQP